MILKMATSITARALSPDEYTVGWICAIPDELGPARAMLDERHAPIESQPSYDDNIYILGSIGKHNIAIACLPEYGVANAATAAKSMQATFRSLRFGLMVGVGGGIPGTWNDIRLGDIVVSLPTEQGGGVIQYDMGRREKDGFRRIGSLNKPPTLLRSAIPNLRTERGLPKNLSRMVADAWKKDATADSDDDSGDEEENEWRYPGVGQDILFKADFDHEDGLATCDACANQEASVIERPARKNTHPLVHYGNIASGNSVMKNAAQRDELAKKESVICFEMEAAGLMDNFPCLVIRGISDYCDSHKNWQWQPYAAAVAAAYAKRLLLVIPPQAVAKLEPIWKNVHWMLAFKKPNPFFTGRVAMLQKLHDALCVRSEKGKALEQRAFVIQGMGGAGKSEVCVKFAHENRERFWGVFWIDATSEESIKHGFLAVGKLCGVQGVSAEEIMRWLENTEHTWLLILDNADSVEIDYARYFLSGRGGSVIMTTRNYNCIQYQTVGSASFDGIEVDDAVTLLLKACKIREELWLRHIPDARKVVAVLSQHPLAITQAGAYIWKGLCSLNEYATELDRERKELLEYHTDQARSEYGGVYATFEVSARALNQSPKQDWIHALVLLGALAYFDREGISEEIFVRAGKLSLQVSNDRYFARNDADDRISVLSAWHVSYLPEFMRRRKVSRDFDVISLRKARDVLRSFSLITVTENQAISMHPLIHTWARDRLESAQQFNAWAMTASIIYLSIGDLVDYDEFHFKIQSHIKTCFRLRPEDCFARAGLETGRETCRIFFRFFWPLYRISDKDFANEIALLLETRISREIAPQTSNWRAILRMLAFTFRDLYDYEKAKQLMEEIVAFDEKNEQKGFDVLESRTVLGSIYNLIGRPEEAVKMLASVVKISQKGNKSAHDIDALLRSQYSLALAYRVSKRPQKALKLSKLVLRGRREILQPAHPNVLNTQNELGRVYLDLGQFQKAIQLFRVVIQRRNVTFGLTHPDTLSSRHSLAYAYSSVGQYHEAISLLQEVVRIRATLKPENPNQLASQFLLAYAYSEVGRYVEAIVLLKQVVRIQAHILDPEHRDRIFAEELLAECIDKSKKQQESPENHTSGEMRSNPEPPTSTANLSGNEQIQSVQELMDTWDTASVAISDASSVEISDASTFVLSDTSSDSEEEALGAETEINSEKRSSGCDRSRGASTIGQNVTLRFSQDSLVLDAKKERKSRSSTKTLDLEHMPQSTSYTPRQPTLAKTSKPHLELPIRSSAAAKTRSSQLPLARTSIEPTKQSQSATSGTVKTEENLGNLQPPNEQRKRRHRTARPHQNPRLTAPILPSAAGTSAPTHPDKKKGKERLCEKMRRFFCKQTPKPQPARQSRNTAEELQNRSQIATCDKPCAQS